MNPTLEAPPPRHGRDRLIEAALELADEKRSFTAVGIRELARQAGLSANAFYRHFDSPDQLGMAVVEHVGKILGGALREVRQEVMGSELLVTAAVESYFQLAVKNRPVFMFCARERYGASADLRRAIQALQEDLVDELAQGVEMLPPVAAIGQETVRELLRNVVEFLNMLMLDYLEAGLGQRAHIIRRAEQFIFTLFAGAHASQRRS